MNRSMSDIIKAVYRVPRYYPPNAQGYLVKDICEELGINMYTTLVIPVGTTVYQDVVARETYSDILILQGSRFCNGYKQLYKRESQLPE